LEFVESFSKPAKLPLDSFQTWWALWCPLSKENCSSATYLPDFKIGEIAPCRFSKVLRDIFHLIEAKDLISPVLKSCQQIQKLLAPNGEELINSVQN
jgi:hypothetical protein